MTLKRNGRYFASIRPKW